MCVPLCARALMCLWGSENNQWEPVLVFHSVGYRDGIPLIKVGSESLYQLSHLLSSKFWTFWFPKWLMCILVVPELQKTQQE